MLGLTVADALDMKTHQQMDQSVIEVQTRLHIFNVMLWISPRLETAVSGQPRSSGQITL